MLTKHEYKRYLSRLNNIYNEPGRLSKENKLDLQKHKNVQKMSKITPKFLKQQNKLLI